MRVSVGKDRIESATESLEVKRTVLHPSIAILKLAQRFKFTDLIQPACLWRSFSSQTKQGGTIESVVRIRSDQEMTEVIPIPIKKFNYCYSHTRDEKVWLLYIERMELIGTAAQIFLQTIR